MKTIVKEAQDITTTTTQYGALRAGNILPVRSYGNDITGLVLVTKVQALTNMTTIWLVKITDFGTDLLSWTEGVSLKYTSDTPVEVVSV